VRRLDYGGGDPAVGAMLGEAAWAEVLSPEELADVLRSSLRAEYDGVGDAEMVDALDSVLDSMSAAEAFNFGSALGQIGKGVSKLTSDPAFAQVVQAAAPIAGGTLGSLIGGPVGAKVGSQLGSLAAQALPTPRAPVPAAPAPPTPAPVPAAPAPAPSAPAVAVPAPTARAVGGGSTAAAQGLVLTQQPEVLRSLLATALGQQGRQQVSGVPVAQVLKLFSDVIGEAAADADELMYLEQQPDAAESVMGDAPGSVRPLYADLLGADNLEFAEAAGWEGFD
jgi:hypothetical protein